MKGQKIGYTRVSTIEQTHERQLDGVALDRVFSDTASGKDADRPQLKAVLVYLRENDTLFVHSMDRLARNVEDMFKIIRELNAKGVTVQFMKENMIFPPATDDPRSTLLMTVLTAFAQFERAILRERQREGIAIAQAKGKYKGRKPSLDAEGIAAVRAKVAAGVPKALVARHFKISRETVYKYLNQSS